MNINKREESGVIILSPDGRLDSNTAPELEQEIDLVASSADGNHLLLDFTRVEYISSAGLRVILKAVKDCQASSRSFAVSSMQDHVREVFEIAGFDAYVPIHADSSQAIASFY